MLRDLDRGRTQIARVAAIVGLAAIVAACGGSAASLAPTTVPAPTTASGASAAGASTAPRSAAPASHSIASTRPAATPAPTQAANIDPMLAHATDAFTHLTSYQYDVTMSGGSYGSVLGDGLSGTVVYAPSFATQFTYVDIEVIQTQDKIWQKNGSSWDLSRYPNAKTTFDSFGPPVLLAHDFTPFVKYYTAAGDEVVENVSTTKFTCNPKALGYFSGLYGFSGSATVSADVWLAKAGGYPVQFEIQASGDASFDLKVVITKANDAANVIHVPTS